MKKGIGYIVAVGLLTMAAATSILGAEAEAAKPSSGATEKVKKPARHSFQGRVSAVDKTAMTIAVDGKTKKHTLHITSRTRISKGGKPATVSDAVVGEEARGQAISHAAGDEEAVTLRLGAPSEGKPAAKKAKKPEAAEKK